MTHGPGDTTRLLSSMQKVLQDIQDDREKASEESFVVFQAAEKLRNNTAEQLERTNQAIQNLSKSKQELDQQLQVVRVSTTKAAEQEPLLLLLRMMIQTEALRCLNTLIMLPGPQTSDDLEQAR
ncbi:hypothetical protein PQX77_003648 [Marasmius sp. AFHP31]|nr:hypothetical protein PQX77_003648 [Marasmius sp. AFHP31]